MVLVEKKKKKREEKWLETRSSESGREREEEVDCNRKTPFAGKQRAINVIAV